MPTFLESGLLIDLPDNASFRISDCSTWEKKLKCNTLKEMDFGWWDADESRLYLLELKDFTKLDHPLAKQSKDRRDFIEDFVIKATDTILLLSAIWLQTRLGLEILPELQQQCQNFPERLVSVKFIFVVKDTSIDAPTKLQPVLDAVRTKLKGRVLLLDFDPLRDILLLDHRTAYKMGLPVTEE